MSENAMEQAEQGMERYFFRASSEDFKFIPGNPLAYWVSLEIKNSFAKNPYLSSIANPCVGLQTGENNRFVREWHEVSFSNFGRDLISREDSKNINKKWFPYNKGGNFRRWYGNQDCVVNWQDDGVEIRRFYDKDGKLRSRPQNMNTYFQPSISWSKISSGLPAFRYFPQGFIYDVAGTSIFTKEDSLRYRILGFVNSLVCQKMLELLSPTLNFEVGHISSLPIKFDAGNNDIINKLIDYSRDDWDSFETSWNFNSKPILAYKSDKKLVSYAYKVLRQRWQYSVVEMKKLEVENNRIFIEAYGLQDELTPDVPLEEITLTCNPHYRYGGNRTDEEREALLLQDTMAEFCSYAVGCMFGRYSLDKPGLVLANQGDTLQDYLQQVPQPSFMPDDDNVIPLLDADWFADDVTGRFLDFLRVTFGTEHYAENLVFVEHGLNVTNKRNYSIRDFFVKEFYDYHVKMYKKRPIYWLFASPKGTFQALVYLHRYRPDTVSVVLRYLREFRDKLAARRQLVEQRLAGASASQGEKTRLAKEQEQLRKQILELDDYEHEVLFPLAGQRLEIDLDDGVKANYPRFGKALKKVAELS